MIKTEQIVAIENAKLKQLNLLSSINNALCDSSKFFFQHLILETLGLRIFSAKCDEILDLDGSVAICQKVLCAFLVNKT